LLSSFVEYARLLSSTGAFRLGVGSAKKGYSDLFRGRRRGWPNKISVDTKSAAKEILQDGGKTRITRTHKMGKSKRGSASVPTSLWGLLFKTVVVVGLAVWAAWAVRPLLHDKHVVALHNDPLSPNFLRNAQGMWLHHSAWLPSGPQSSIKYLNSLQEI
jgi:hypothetical protein